MLVGGNGGQRLFVGFDMIHVPTKFSSSILNSNLGENLVGGANVAKDDINGNYITFLASMQILGTFHARSGSGK